MPDNVNSRGPFKDQKLGKSEIVRGNGAFQKILKSPLVRSGKYVKILANVSLIQESTGYKSPPETSKVRVGFLIARKKVRKANQRNRMKRLLRECYRRNKNLLITSERSISMLLTLTDSGYDMATSNPGIKMQILEEDLKLQLNSLNEMFI